MFFIFQVFKNAVAKCFFTFQVFKNAVAKCFLLSKSLEMLSQNVFYFPSL